MNLRIVLAVMSCSLVCATEAFPRGTTQNERLSLGERAAYSKNKHNTYTEIASVLGGAGDLTEDQQMEQAIALSKAEKWDLRAKLLEAQAASQIEENSKKEHEHEKTQHQNPGSIKPSFQAFKPFVIPASFIAGRPMPQRSYLDFQAKANSKLTLAEFLVPGEDFAIEAPTLEPLKDLTVGERKAGLGGSEEYSQLFAREMMNLMHRFGAQMPLHHLEPIFVHGLFNYYFRLYIGFNPNFEQKEWIIDEHQALFFGSPKKWGLFPCPSSKQELFGARTRDILYFLAEASEKFKENPHLRYLGSLFQKQKVRVELLGKTQDFENLVKESQRVELQQLVIARWIEAVALELIMNTLPYLKKELPLQPERDALVQSLPFLRPKFLDDPFYASAFNLLETTKLGPDQSLPEAEQNYLSYVKAGYKVRVQCTQTRTRYRY